MTDVVAPALLLDTYSLFFRAYHALPDMRTTRGEPTAAMYGFLALFLKLLRERRPMSIAFALDVKEETFRRRRYAEYKAGRDAVPDRLLAQLSRLHELLSLLEVPVHYAPGYEADDVLATLARELRERDEPALVVSGDRDLLQVAHGSVNVLFAGARGKDAVLYGAAEVEARFGVAPQALPAWVALVGDPSDNLPKVPGIGPRTATELVRRFGNMEGLLRRLSEVDPPKLRAVLELYREQIIMTEQLARLEDRLPLTPEPRALPISPRAFEQLRALFVELEFHSLIPRLAALAPKELI
jgi:DNA polymerase-1